MEAEGSRCLRREQDTIGNGRKFTKQNAKEDCSQNKRCVGIETIGEKDKDDPYGGDVFKLCLDSIYQSTARDKYNNLDSRVLQKEASYGNYITTQEEA